MHLNLRRLTLRVYAAFSLMGGLLTLVALLNLPTDPKNTWLFGYSKVRLISIGGVLLLMAVFGVLSWRFWRNPAWEQRVGQTLHKWLDRNWLYGVIFALSTLALILGIYVDALADQLNDHLVQPRMARVAPIALWFAALGAQVVLALPILRYDQALESVKIAPKIIRAMVIVLLVFGLLGGFMAITRIGLEPDVVNWDDPGAPLLVTQLFLALLTALIVLGGWALLRRILRRIGHPRLYPDRFLKGDVFVAVLVWLLAVLIWWAEPLTPDYFAPELRPPNFEYYPYSDAAGYDLTAQNLLIGEGYTTVAEKPLYNVFLLGLHLLAGQDYLSVVSLQIVVLALFPVGLYLLAVSLHSRAAGLILAMLVIFREKNAIALSGETRVSHSKLLMSDLPAALGIALLCLLSVVWLQRVGKKRQLPLLMGGALGLIVLLRSQTIVLVPLLLAIIVLSLYRNPKRLLEGGLLFSLGLFVVLSPWMWRNYQKTGRISYTDQPQQALLLAKQWRLDPASEESVFPPGTPPSAFNELGFAQARQFAITYPGEVARFISAHFLHNELATLLALPVSYTRINFDNHNPPPWLDVDPYLWYSCCSLSTYIAQAPFWGEVEGSALSWDGELPVENRLPLLVNVLLIALGISVMWSRWRWVGLVPLFVHLAYNFSVAFARVSGWRLILPADWVGFLYYAVGLGQLLLWAKGYVLGRQGKLAVGVDLRPEPATSHAIQFPGRVVMGATAGLFLLGLLVPLVGVVIPARYTGISEQEALTWLQQSGGAAWSGDIPQAFLEDERSIVLQGRALYPRYYLAEQGESGSGWSSMAPRPFSRVGFVLIGPVGAQVVLPLDEPPDKFPNASDVLVFGCHRDEYIEARVVMILDAAPTTVLASDAAMNPCSVADTP